MGSKHLRPNLDFTCFLANFMSKLGKKHLKGPKSSYMSSWIFNSKNDGLISQQVDIENLKQRLPQSGFSLFKLLNQHVQFFFQGKDIFRIGGLASSAHSSCLFFFLLHWGFMNERNLPHKIIRFCRKYFRCECLREQNHVSRDFKVRLSLFLLLWKLLRKMEEIQFLIKLNRENIQQVLSHICPWWWRISFWTSEL